MALSINTNLSSLNAQRNLSKTQNMLESAMSHLSSGMRITKASDDAAGLAISTKLQAHIRSANQAARNANDGLSMIQTAEQALDTISKLLTRVRELAMQAANATVAGDATTGDRGILNAEADKLLTEVGRIATDTEFNGVGLLGSAAASDVNIQVGIDASNSTIAVSVNGLTGLSASVTWGDAAAAQGSLGAMDTQLATVSSVRAKFGAAANALQGALENAQTYAESLAAANSRIRDVDVAEETAALSKAQVLAQAGISVLAQANQAPQMALKLLG